MVVLVPQHAGEAGRADRAELDRTVAEALGDLPDRGVFERAAGQFVGNDTRLVRLLHLPQDLAGPQAMALHPAARGVAVAGNAAEPLDRIEEPGFAADREIEAAVAIADDVEPGGFLRVDDRGDRVEILLAEQGIAHRRFERAPIEAGVVPQGARIRPGDRGRQHHVAGGGQHSSPHLVVMPAKADIQVNRNVTCSWNPACAAVTIKQNGAPVFRAPAAAARRRPEAAGASGRVETYNAAKTA